MNTSFVKSDKPLFKTNFNPVNDIHKAMKYSNGNFNHIWNTIAHYSLVMDNFHFIKDTGYFRQSLKKSMLNLNEYFIPIVGRDKIIMETPKEGFEKYEMDSEVIMSEEELFTRFIAMLQVPDKGTLNDLATAWNENPKLVSSICRKCLKKPQNQSEGSLYTTKQLQFLRLLDYTVNLIFLREFSDNIKVHTYDKTKMKSFINQVLAELRPILKRDFRLIFKSEDEVDLISQYEIIVSFVKETRVEQRTAISQLVDAWNADRKAMEGVLNKILK